MTSDRAARGQRAGALIAHLNAIGAHVATARARVRAYHQDGRLMDICTARATMRSVQADAADLLADLEALAELAGPASATAAAEAHPGLAVAATPARWSP